MAKEKIIEFKKVEISTSGLKIVKPPELSFKVEVELDKKMEKVAAKDTLLVQELQDAAKEVFDQTKKTVEKKVKLFDDLIQGMVDKGEKPDAIKKQLDGLNKAIEQDVAVGEKGAEAAVEAAFEKLKSKRKEWKKFKIKAACSIGKTVAGLAVSIGLMASAPFTGGASAALSIIGFVKSGITIAKEIGKLAAGIETAVKVLEKELAFVEATAKNKGLYASNEVAATLITEFVGVAQPSIKACQEQGDTVSAQHAKLVGKVHDAAEDLGAIMTKTVELRDGLRTEAEARLKKLPMTAAAKAAQKKLIEKNIDDALKTAEKAVDDQIKRVQTMYAEVKGWEPKVKTLADRVEDLSIKDPKGLKVFREGVKLSAIALGAIDGNKIADSADKLAQGLVPAATTYVYDKVVSKTMDGTVFDAA